MGQIVGKWQFELFHGGSMQGKVVGDIAQENGNVKHCRGAILLSTIMGVVSRGNGNVRHCEGNSSGKNVGDLAMRIGNVGNVAGQYYGSCGQGKW